MIEGRVVIHARVVLPMHGPPIKNGAVAISQGRIQAVGTSEEVAATGYTDLDLGDMILLPGLINSHTHLDYTCMKRAIFPCGSFTAWVQRLNAIKRTLDEDDFLASVLRGFDECRRWGTTSICNIESFPTLLLRLPPPRLRTWWFYELIDVRMRTTTDDLIAGALNFFSKGGRLQYFGLSPHAPYTSSVELFQLAKLCGDATGMPLTTHVSESREEWNMFSHGRGLLHDFLARLGRNMGDCVEGTSPFRHLWSAGVIDQRWILAHMNEMDEADFELLASLPKGGGPHIVHCPGSHAFFGHTPFPLMRLREIGVNICIATDSLASTDSLSLFCEMRRTKLNFPELTARELLSMVTTRPALALNMQGELGQITPGAIADLIAIPHQNSEKDIYEQVLEHSAPVPWMMVDGQILDD